MEYWHETTILLLNDKALHEKRKHHQSTNYFEQYHPLARIGRQNTLQTTRFSIMKKDAPFLAAVEASLEYKEGQSQAQ